MARYRISIKSEEQRGATQPNIIEMEFADDAAALAFQAVLDPLLAGKIATVDKVMSQNYVLPYPDGTDANVRFAMWNGRFQAQMRLMDLAADVDVPALCQALIDAGIRLPAYAMPLAVSINPYVFNPKATV